MKDLDVDFDEFDEINNLRPEECEFDRVVESAISRRGFRCWISNPSQARLMA